MAGKKMRTLLGQLGLTQVRHVSAVRLRAAPPLVREVYGQVEADFGVLAPPVALHAPAPRVLAASWLMLRETLLMTGRLERPVKEAVATAVSRANTCPFCVTVHNNTLSGLTVHDDTLPGLAGPAEMLLTADGQLGPGTDVAVRAATAWAADSMTEPGAAQHQPVCQADQAPELIGTAVLLHYLNRMVNVFLGEVPLPPGVPKFMLGRVMRTLGGMIRAAAREPHPPGMSLQLLPSASLPGDLSWAAADSVVAEAFARACAAIDEAAARSVPDVVKDAVTAELAGWHGEPRGPSRAWVEDRVTGLPYARRAAARLALLTAFASYQVDHTVIEQVRRDGTSDAEMIELTAWASLAAARRAGGWIPVGAPASTATPAA